MSKDYEDLMARIGDVPPGLLRSRFERISYVAPLVGQRAEQDRLLHRHFCVDVDLVLVSGHGETSENGEGLLAINSDRYCLGALIINEPQFVATPNTDSPVFLAWTHAAEKVEVQSSRYLCRLDGSDLRSGPTSYSKELRVTVRTWAPDGAKAGHVGFSWACILEVARLCVREY